MENISNYDFKALKERTSESSHPASLTYLSAPCSAGKTHAICQRIADLWQHESNVLLVLPTRFLIAEVSQKLKDMNVVHSVITSDTHPKNVKSAMVQHLIDAPGSGDVLLVTLETFIKIEYFNRRTNWKIIIDEIPTPDEFMAFKLPRNSSHILDHVVTAPSGIAGMLLAKPRNKSKLKKIVDGPADTVTDHFKDLYRALLSKNREVFVEEDMWNAFISAADTEEGTINFLSMLNIHGLQGCLIMGANFEKSMLSIWLSQRYNVRMQEDQHLKSSLRFTSHDFEDRAKVHYLLDTNSFSKALKAKADKNGLIVKEQMDASVLEFFGSREFLWIDNNNDKSDSLSQCRNGTKIPVKCHGLNKYQTSCGIYISAALNKTPFHTRMLHKIGFTNEMLVTSTAHEVYYQAIMRTSLRDPDATTEVDIVLPDRASAVAIAGLLGVTEVHCVASLICLGTSYDLKSRKSRSRSNKSFEAHFPKVVQNPYMIKGKCTNIGNMEDDRIYVTLHKSIYDKEDDLFVPVDVELDELVQFFRTQSSNVERVKEKLHLYNPSLYLRTNPNGSLRSSDNFVQSSMLVLDFDKGELSPEEFVRLFGSKAPTDRRLSFMIMNTFSRNEDQPNRFRVVLPYISPATSIVQHNFCCDYIVHLLKEQGYDEVRSGLDTNSRSPVQSFFLPCRVPGHEKYAFFENHSTRQREFYLYGLNPQAIPEEFLEVKTFNFDMDAIRHDDVPLDLIKEVVMSWEFTAGERNKQMWNLTKTLWYNEWGGKKMSLKLLEEILDSISQHNRDLRSHAKSSMNTLSNNRNKWIKYKAQQGE